MKERGGEQIAGQQVRLHLTHGGQRRQQIIAQGRGIERAIQSIRAENTRSPRCSRSGGAK